MTDLAEAQAPLEAALKDEIIPTGKLIGVDLNPAMCEKARVHTGESGSSIDCRAGLVLVLPILLLMAACASGRGELSEAERAAVQTAVDSAMEAFEAAERARDPERLIAHLAPDFYMYSDGVRTSYDSVVASIRRTMPAMQHFEPGFADVEVRVLGPDAAFATFTFNDSIVTASGETLQSTGPTTLVWERRGTDWLIVYADADHYPVAE